jgi:hypothetical protein
MATHQSPLAVIVKGALAGAAGTAVMSAFMERAPELIERAGVGAPEPPAPPDDPDAAGSPTEELAERITEGALEGEERAMAGQAMILVEMHVRALDGSRLTGVSAPAWPIVRPTGATTRRRRILLAGAPTRRRFSR